MARRTLLLALALGLLVSAPTGPAATGLRAVVGPDGLAFTDGEGKPVTQLAPGSYTIEVDDRSAIHNVHVAGPGVRLDSGLGFVGTTTWTATFRDGVYSVVSDPQADSLALTVVAGSPAEPTLFATVTDSEIALRRGDGSVVTQLDPGTYAVAVDDSSSAESFVLVGPDVEEHTQRHVPARTTWLVTFREGVYRFFSARRPTALQGSFRVGSAGDVPTSKLLIARTGSDFAISLVDSSNAPLGRLEAGTYTVQVDDRSPDHNFRLTGPGVNVATMLPEVGARTFTVRLTGGDYAFLCDPHTQTMLGGFTVPRAALRRLTATLASGGRVTLSGAGGLRAGPALVTVSDRSPKLGFRLAGPGVSRRTSEAFRGTVTWRVTLARGTYRYGAGRRLRSFRVA